MKTFVFRLLSSAMSGLALVPSLLVSAAQAAWFTTYRCGDYTITLRGDLQSDGEDTGRAYTYSYRASGPSGELSIEEGDRTRGENAWFYSFENNNTVYLIEDLWDTRINQPASAFLRAVRYTDEQEGGVFILDEACTKLEIGV